MKTEPSNYSWFPCPAKTGLCRRPAPHGIAGVELFTEERR